MANRTVAQKVWQEDNEYAKLASQRKPTEGPGRDDLHHSRHPTSCFVWIACGAARGQGLQGTSRGADGWQTPLRSKLHIALSTQIAPRKHNVANHAATENVSRGKQARRITPPRKLPPARQLRPTEDPGTVTYKILSQLPDVDRPWGDLIAELKDLRGRTSGQGSHPNRPPPCRPELALSCARYTGAC